MTKEDLFDSFSRYHVFSNDEVYKRLEKFFDSNVVITIKPKEPIYEYKVCMHFHDGSYEHTERYFTVNEFREFGFPKCCLLDDTTKRIRQ